MASSYIVPEKEGWEKGSNDGMVEKEEESGNELQSIDDLPKLGCFRQSRRVCVIYFNSKYFTSVYIYIFILNKMSSDIQGSIRPT